MRTNIESYLSFPILLYRLLTQPLWIMSEKLWDITSWMYLFISEHRDDHKDT